MPAQSIAARCQFGVKIDEGSAIFCTGELRLKPIDLVNVLPIAFDARQHARLEPLESPAHALDVHALLGRNRSSQAPRLGALRKHRVRIEVDAQRFPRCKAQLGWYLLCD